MDEQRGSALSTCELHMPRVPTVRQNVTLNLSLLQTPDDSNAHTGPCEDPRCVKTEVQRRLTSSWLLTPIHYSFNLLRA